MIWRDPYTVVTGQSIDDALHDLHDQPDDYPVEIKGRRITLGELRTFAVLIQFR